MIKNVSIVLMLMLLVLPDAQAQNGTNSPLSIFGIGEIEVRDFGRTTAMGSVGIGFQSDNFLNRRNPAGLSAIDTLRFILDVSASLKMSQFKTKTLREQSTVFSFKSLAVGLRLSKMWTSSVGLSPYSNVGYKFTDTQMLSGMEFTTVYSSSGGINRVYWDNAFELFKGFSIGVNSSFIFGNITQSEDMSAFSIKDTYNVSKLYFDFGAQYAHWFGQYTKVIIGGIYGNKSKMFIQHRRNNSGMERDQRLPDRKSYIPETYGGGFSILRNKRAAEWVFAADCQYWNWSVDPYSYSKGKFRYSDSRILSAGLRLTPNTHYAEKYFQAIRYHLGASYNESYLKINGYQMVDLSVSLGLGLPFVNNRTHERSYVNIAAIFGESGTGQKGGITERYVLFSVNLSLIERWFAKWQFD